MVTAVKVAKTESQLESDIQDCHTILAMPNLCEELRKPTSKVLKQKQELLSFL